MTTLDLTNLRALAAKWADEASTGFERAMTYRTSGMFETAAVHRTRAKQILSASEQLTAELDRLEGINPPTSVDQMDHAPDQTPDSLQTPARTCSGEGSNFSHKAALERLHNNLFQECPPHAEAPHSTPLPSTGAEAETAPALACPSANAPSQPAPGNTEQAPPQTAIPFVGPIPQHRERRTGAPHANPEGCSATVELPPQTKAEDFSNSSPDSAAA